MENSTIRSLLELAKEGRNHCNQTQPSIFVVPWIYRNQNPSCFDPRVVSIGPIHRNLEKLQKQDGLKGAYMHDLLSRVRSPSKQTLESCLQKVNSKIMTIKSCYGGMNNDRDSDVALMMVTDACFILEVIQKICEKKYENDFERNSIKTDLLLIENQIPFFVLQDIFDLTLKKIQPNKTLITLIVDHVLPDYKIFKSEENMVIDGYHCKHILEILHKTCKPHTIKSRLPPQHISYSVVDLDLAGIKFEPNRDGNMEMTLKNASAGWLCIFGSFGKPTLIMPVLEIQDKTELLLRNLIAYEQTYPHVYPNVADDHYFTSFAVAMNMLVDTTEDVAKLVESKVITNWLGSNENAVNMINSICTEVVCSSFMYRTQFKALDDYYQSYWPKNMAWLRRRYFSSPWTAIALVAGILLFALTTIQTIFTVYPSA